MINREPLLFVINGLISVAIAYVIYKNLVDIGILIEIAIVVSYLGGLLFGFFANKILAFRDDGSNSKKKLIRYIVLHAFSLLINAFFNSIFLMYFNQFSFKFLAAFMLSIGLSTIVNFIGLKYWVFVRLNN